MRGEDGCSSSARRDLVGMKMTRSVGTLVSLEMPCGERKAQSRRGEAARRGVGGGGDERICNVLSTQRDRSRDGTISGKFQVLNHISHFFFYQPTTKWSPSGYGKRLVTAFLEMEDAAAPAGGSPGFLASMSSGGESSGPEEMNSDKKKRRSKPRGGRARRTLAPLLAGRCSWHQSSTPAWPLSAVQSPCPHERCAGNTNP